MARLRPSLSQNIAGSRSGNIISVPPGHDCDSGSALPPVKLAGYFHWSLRDRRAFSPASALRRGVTSDNSLEPSRTSTHTRGADSHVLFPIKHKDALGPALTHQVHGHRQGLE